MLKVVAALVKKDNKYLIARRIYGDPESVGKWEFPGGKIEENETEEHAVEREIKEEFELDIQADQFITNSIYEYPNKLIDLRLIHCHYIKGEFHLHDHSEYQFVSKEHLLEYDLAPADIPLAEFIQKNTF
jgi:8-oxo-dGTP diphosphatase